MNEIINTILISFLKKKNVDYSLMINGLWGCGKTYYVTRDLKDIAAQEKYKFVYQSLSGENDLLHFKRDILVKLLYDNKKGADNNFISNALDVAKYIPKIGQAVEGITKLKDVGENKLFEVMKWDNILLVIDDFERIGKGICHEDILGLVYETFISKNIHTIFVSDEEKIINVAYRLQKEKAIRRTINYEPELSSQLTQIISQHYKDKKIHEYYKKCPQFLVDTLLKLKIKNLRTITFILDHCDDILEAINDNVNEDIFNSLMINVAILTNEIKNGKIGISDIESNKGLNKITAYPFFYNLDKKKEEEKTYAEKYYDKYNRGLGLNFIYVDSIFTFLLNGYLNKELFINEYKSIFLHEVPEEKAIIGILASCREVEETVLEDAVSKLIKYLKEGKYHLTEIINYYTLLRFVDERKYIAKLKINYKKVFESAIKESSKNPDKLPTEYGGDFSRNVYDESKTKEALYIEMSKKIKRIVDANSNKLNSDKINNLFTHIINDDGEQWEIYRTYALSKLLRDIVETNNQNLFTKLNNKGIYCWEAILRNDILKISNAGEYGYEQKEHLEIIKKEIRNYTTKRIGNMRKLRYIEFIEMIENAMTHLENTKKKVNL